MAQDKPTTSHFKANIVLYGALVANLGIAAAKFVAAAISVVGDRGARIQCAARWRRLVA